MDERHYTYHDLLDIYLRVRRDRYPSLVNKNYERRLLAALEQIYQVDFSGRHGLWSFFNKMIETYLSLRAPLQGYDEAGFLGVSIRREKLGQHILGISELTGALREKYYDFLYELFEQIYGPRDFVATSRDLAAKGFDDSWQPLDTEYEDGDPGI